MHSDETLDQLATEMLGLWNDHEPISTDACSVDVTTLTLDEAYQAQDHLIEKRVGQGERIVGYKIGCTSKSTRSGLGATTSVNGRLLAPGIHDDGAEFDHASMLAPAVEAEMVIHLRTGLAGPDLDDDTIRQAIDWVAPGVEIHAASFPAGKPSLQGLIATNCVHHSMVIGRPVPFPDGLDIDLDMEGIALVMNGELIESGVGLEIEGGPLYSLRWLAGELHRRSHHIEAGQYIIPGSTAGLYPVEPDTTVEARFTRLGTAHATFR